MMTLDRNIGDYHTEMEQAAFELNNLVPATGLSPDKVLLARGFSHADVHRARLGVNDKQIPVNAPKVPVHSYSTDGLMRVNNVSDPVYPPNSYRGPKSDPEQYPELAVWAATVRLAYTCPRCRPRGPAPQGRRRSEARCPARGWNTSTSTASRRR